MSAKPLTWASFFCRENKFYTAFQVWLFNFNITIKTCFETIFRKTEKKRWDDISYLNKSLEP